MRHRIRFQVCSVVLVLACAATFGVRRVTTAPAAVVFDIPGRADATPWAAASGAFVAVTWGASSEGKTDVFLAVSRDGGTTFGPPVQVNVIAGEARLGGELPPRVTLISRPGASLPEIAVLWTARAAATEIKVARSRDGGKTFSAPVTLQAAGAPGDRGWPAVTFDHQGIVHAVWLDHREMAAKRTAGASHAGHKAGAEHDGAAMAQKSGLFYAAFSARPQERLLTNGVCYCCKTALAAGPGGTLFAAWRHVYPGNLRDMAFTMSRDGGRSFSPPARVSEDGWAINGCPDDGPAMAVDARGTAHLVWPTVLDGAAPGGAIFYTSTRDGRRFTQRIRIPTLGGPKPSHPQIVLDRRGRLFVAWDESLNGRRTAAVRELRFNQIGAPSFGDAVPLSTDAAALYPVLAATDKGLLAVWTVSGDPSRVEARLVPMP